MATLILEDGSRFEGTMFGHQAPVTGEVVFTTGMLGYQETMTDPAYCGQIVCMTYPLIGNVGINDLDFESDRVHMKGVVVSELCELPSNWQLKQKLEDYLAQQGVVGLYGVDTRALARHIRKNGAMRGCIVAGEAQESDVQAAKAHALHDQVASVTCEAAYTLGEGDLHIAVVDLGAKKSLIASLTERGCRVTVYPANTPAEAILADGCHGALISAGPGDPHDVPDAIDTARILMEKMPVMGVGLGHLVMALASGCAVGKMVYGHHGVNQPVKDLLRGTCAVTGQAIGYEVKRDALADGVSISHVNWNDQTVEGLVYAGKDAFSVAFVPEGKGSAFDTAYLYEGFLAQVRGAMSK